MTNRPKDTEAEVSAKFEAVEEIARIKGDYEASGNPMWVWRAYFVARERGLPCPAWVLDYFDRSAANLLEGTNPSALPRKRAIGPAIVRALGFTGKPRRKRFNPFDLGERDLAIADHIYLQLCHGQKLLHAYETTAKELGQFRRTVERAWKKVGPSIPFRTDESRWRKEGQVRAVKARRRPLATK